MMRQNQEFIATIKSRLGDLKDNFKIDNSESSTLQKLKAFENQINEKISNLNSLMAEN